MFMFIRVNQQFIIHLEWDLIWHYLITEQVIQMLYRVYSIIALVLDHISNKIENVGIIISHISCMISVAYFLVLKWDIKAYGAQWQSKVNCIYKLTTMWLIITFEGSFCLYKS